MIAEYQGHKNLWSREHGDHCVHPAFEAGELASHVRLSITERGCVDQGSARVWGPGQNVENPKTLCSDCGLTNCQESCAFPDGSQELIKQVLSRMTSLAIWK